MLHSITIHFGFDPHTVHGAWALIGMVVIFVVVTLAFLRAFKPVQAAQFKEHELERLHALHEKTSTTILDA